MNALAKSRKRFCKQLRESPPPLAAPKSHGSQAASRRAAWEAEARRALEAKQHFPRLFRDADGDESNEFWVERADLGRLVKVTSDGLSEIYKR